MAAAPLGSTLRISIVGAGMGGLSTALALAHAGFQRIDVYEIADDLGFVGAGIQVAPNMIRILRNLSVWDYIEHDAVEVKEVSIRLGQSDEELAHINLQHVAGSYGAAHYVAHRFSLANALYRGCKDAAPRVKFHFCTTITDVDFENHRICVKNRDECGAGGTWINTDVILGADGIKSSIRRRILARHGEQDNAQPTGIAAYRIMLDRAQLIHDPELLALLDSNSIYRWIGPNHHIIAYPISDHSIFNISTTQPDTNFASEATTTWTTRADKNVMLGVFSDFCPRVNTLLKLVPEGEICEWRLRVHPPLRTWVEGNVALIGDACHPTLPHLNQGAAQAIEDGAVLGVILGKVTHKKDIHRALVVYERLRKERTTYLAEQAAECSRALHLADPKAQAIRNEALRQVKNGGPNPEKSTDKTMVDFCYGFDCVKDAEEHFVEYMAAEKQVRSHL